MGFSDKIVGYSLHDFYRESNGGDHPIAVKAMYEVKLRRRLSFIHTTLFLRRQLNEAPQFYPGC
jgi:hypothetical protein